MKKILKGFLNFSGNKHTISKEELILCKDFMDLDMEKIADPKALTFEVWGLKTSLWQFGPKALCMDLSSHYKGGRKLAEMKNIWYSSYE